MLLACGVGACFSKTYHKMAEYYETELMDFRKADKIYRSGLSYLRSLEEKSKKEFGNLSSLYERFSDRMLKKIENETVKEVNEVRRGG